MKTKKKNKMSVKKINRESQYLRNMKTMHRNRVRYKSNDNYST